MSSEEALLMGVWDAVRDHLPHNKRNEVAKDLLHAFSEFGFEPTELASAADEDPDLSEAFDEVFPPPEYEDDEYDDEVDE